MYATHFGLVESPFSITPDPRFSYTNSLYREAFATLRYGIEARKGFIVITGEAGTGKTTLLRRLMRSAEATVHTAFVFNTHLSFTELLRLVLNDLGVPSCADDKLTLIAHLNDYLVEQLEKAHTVALLVDEAQDLSNEMLEELRLLSNLETDRAKLIQIVLMGQPELERKLDQPELRQLKQRVAIRCRLAPLKSNEVAPYIQSRLQTVGYNGEALFELEAVQNIALYSKGIPRLINVICDNALLIAYATSKSKVSAKMIDEVARDLQLTEPSQINWQRQRCRISKETFLTTQRPKHTVKVARSQPDVTEYLPAVEPPPHRRHHRRTMAGVGIGALLTVVVVAGTILYAQQSGSLAAFGVQIEDLVGVRWKNRAQAPENITQDTLGQLHVRHLQVTTSRASEFLMGNPATTVRRLSQKNFSSPPAHGQVQVYRRKCQVIRPPKSSISNASDTKTKVKERSDQLELLRSLALPTSEISRDRMPRSPACWSPVLGSRSRVRRVTISVYALWIKNRSAVTFTAKTPSSNPPNSQSIIGSKSPRLKTLVLLLKPNQRAFRIDAFQLQHCFGK